MQTLMLYYHFYKLLCFITIVLQQINYCQLLLLFCVYFRVRDFWTEQGPTDILLKLRRKEITLFRAAEQLNVTPQTLSNYLISMSQLDSEANMSSHSNPMDTYEEGDSEEEGDSILPDAPSNSSIFKSMMVSSTPPTTSSNSVLANCPDITIIKKEKLEGLLAKVNNNSDHSDRQSGNSDQSQK